MNLIYFGDCRQTMHQLIEQGTKVHMCGNSVSPLPMAAIAEANNPFVIGSKVKGAG